MNKNILKNKVFLTLASLFVLYSVIGFVIVPFTAKKVVPKKLGTALNRNVAVEKIKFNPFTFSLKINGFKIYTKDNEKILAGFDSMYLDLNLLSSVFGLSLNIKEADLSGMQLYISRLDKNAFNFSDILNKKDKGLGRKDDTASDKEFGFFIGNINILDTNCIFADNFYGVEHKLLKLNLNIPYISNLEKYKNDFVNISTDFTFNDASIKAHISSRVFDKDLKSDLKLSLKNFKIDKYYNYIKEQVNFIPKKGHVDLDLKAFFEKDKVFLINAETSLKDFLMSGLDGKEILSLKELSIKTGDIQPLKNIYNINSVGLESLNTNIARKNSIINILSLVKKDASENLSEDESSKSKDLPELKVEKISVKNSGLIFKDFDSPLFKAEISKEPAKLKVSDINFTVNNLSLHEKNPADFVFELLINDKTKLSSKGSFKPIPFEAQITADIDKLYLSYLNDYIPANIDLKVTSGYINSNLKSVVKLQDNSPKLSLDANFFLHSLKTVERNSVKDFFSITELGLEDISFNLNPMSLDIRNINISGINQNIVKNKHGRVNLASVFETSGSSKEDAEDEKKAAKELFPIDIKNITIKNVGANYADLSIEPYFSSSVLIDLATIKGLSTKAFTGADFDLKGKINKNSSLTASGKLNPLLKDLLVDLKINITNLNLSNLSSYSGKYIGRGIKKGQLSLDLNYDIKKRKLNAENIFFLDQFELGRNIQSKTAANLPVGLAVALLKDRKGEIHLDVPVSGSFDDPEFRVGKIIFQVLKNIIVKAATSPFALVASIAGSGEDLQFIEYEYGSLNLKPSSEEKINDIAKILFERPELKLDLSGYSDMKNDKEALENKNFEALIKDSVKDTDHKESYVKDLKKIYKDIFNKKPEIPENEDEEAYLTGKIKSSFNIGKEDLRLLAMQRSRKVKQLILDLQEIDASRLFVNDTEKIEPDKNKKAVKSRVELGLK